MTEVVAQLKNLRMSAYKVRLVTDAVKGMPVGAALARLQFIPRISSPVVAKLIQSALANAVHNYNLKAEDMMVKNITVNQAIALKRFRPAAFGSAHKLRKHGCHIRVVLTSQATVPASTNATKESTSTAQENGAVKNVGTSVKASAPKKKVAPKTTGTRAAVKKAAVKNKETK